MENAWMLRNDGTAFAVDHHIYADPEDGDDITKAAQWLYLHTGCFKVQQVICRMFALWAWKNNPDAGASDTLEDYATQNEGFFAENSFIKKELKPMLFIMDQRRRLHLVQEDIHDYYEIVLMWLNQEFLRVRYGGMYDSEKGCKDIIFRISSVGFDWYPYIQRFVGRSELDIETVTIVRDAESTGAKNATYRTLDQEGRYDKMPVRDFLAERKNDITPKNHLYYMEGSANMSSREALASLFCGRARFGESLRLLGREIKRLQTLENSRVMEG